MIPDSDTVAAPSRMFSTNIRYGRSALESVNTCAAGRRVSDDQRIDLAVANRAQRLLGLAQARVEARARLERRPRLSRRLSRRHLRGSLRRCVPDPDPGEVVGLSSDDIRPGTGGTIESARRRRILTWSDMSPTSIRGGSGWSLTSVGVASTWCALGQGRLLVEVDDVRWWRPLRWASQISRTLAIACADESDAPLTNSVSA